ncbi:phosphomevalonate kinase isoform X1 [Maniola jurtina]|uniref:phosphomevalonate kinase isoform X1 n=2 Tax=Maniola jurtina TaxID=191418 RepID=UPI001E68A02A|nr:phosphomevalonate kinase isoform X1 [Maniola jurtina]
MCHNQRLQQSELDDTMSPKVILLFSGKRKCGKDFLTDRLKEKFGDKCEIIKISKPIKNHWAKENNLNLNELLSDGEYKELYRLAMIKWSDEMREKDYGCFCRAACENAVDKPIWIVSDIRRATDVQWFKETYGDLIRTIRLIADEETRIERGFQFKPGVDDVASECGLDNYNEWDLVINNGKERQSLEEQLSSIVALIPNL